MRRRGRWPADAIVVLGGGVEPDGTVTPLSRSRVERAAELLRRAVAPRIILTGRFGLGQEGEPAVTEATAMARYAIAFLGVPEEAVLLEEEARDTLGNAYFTRRDWLDPYGWKRIRVVTSDFHLSRAAWVFRKVLGADYDFSFVSAFSGLSPRELIERTLEEARISIFLNEWLAAVAEGDKGALERLITSEHPGYAALPALSHDELRRRLGEIARIDRLEGGAGWIVGPV